MEIDINQLVTDIKNALSENLNKDISTIRGFSNRQLNGIVHQTSLVANAIAGGNVSNSTRDFFLEQLVELARNFVNTLVGLLIATIERLWNALVDLLWKAISKVIGSQLPVFNIL